ncbi:hypothetical protein HDU81_001764, partial [Chytriomyces hyalinus]
MSKWSQQETDAAKALRLGQLRDGRKNDALVRSHLISKIDSLVLGLIGDLPTAKQ